MSVDEQWRAQFDVEVTFANSGGLQAQGFRLDIPGDDIDDDSLGALFVSHLGLLMVDRVRISNKRLLREPHKGSRGVMPAGAAGAATARVVDLTHPIRHGMVTVPGLPGPELSDQLTREESRSRYAPGTEFHMGRISMIGNTGTYLDAPFHRYPDGVDLRGLPLARTVGLDGLVVRTTGAASRAVTRELLLPYRVAGAAVLVHTGWDRHWGTERYGEDHPYLTEDAARWLADQGARLVGIDSVNIDDSSPAAGGARPAHSILLAAGIPVVEHLRGLDDLPIDGFRFHAAPLPVEGLGTSPVRAYAIVQ